MTAQIEARLQAALAYAPDDPSTYGPFSTHAPEDIRYLLTKVDIIGGHRDHLVAELAAAVRRAETAEADADRLYEAFYSTGSGPNNALAAHREAVARRPS